MRCRDLLERKVLRWVIFKEKKNQRNNYTLREISPKERSRTNK